MTDKQFRKEVLAMIEYLEKDRRLNVGECVAVLGATVTAMITDERNAAKFLATLKDNMADRIAAYNAKQVRH